MAPKVDPDRLTADDRADLRALVHLLAELLGCARTTAFVPEKRCSKCHELKPGEMFTRDRYSPDGFDNRCRLCRRLERAKAGRR